MKYTINLPKILNLVFSLILIAGFSAPRLAADLSSFDQSPYSYGPEGRPIQDLQEFQRPSEMVSIVKYRPVMTRDKYGVIEFWSPSGLPLATINSDGSMVFQLNGTTIDENQSGTVTQKIKVQTNSNKAVITDGQGNYLGYQVLEAGYNVKQQYDSNGNVVESYNYSQFGKTISYVVNELTQTKTIFDSSGLPTNDINYEGAIVATYVYDDHSRLMYKTDIQGNKTYYSLSNGQMTKTEDQYGNVLEQYYYKTDPRTGMQMLNTSVDNYSRTTYYTNGKPQVVKDAQGNTVEEYIYNGQTLVCTFDNTLGQATWYDINGNPLYISKDNVEVQSWFYSKGVLIGIWNDADNVLTGYIRGDPVASFLFTQKPSVEVVQQMIDDGIIQKNYLQ